MFRQSLKMLLWMLLVTGIMYPLLITVIAQLTMPFQANGSFIINNKKKVGSLLIGQKFESEKYFWGRPSAINYDPKSSGGSNLGPISIVLKNLVEKRKIDLIRANKFQKNEVPSDLLFASGSGLDPHITVEAVYFQKARIINARGFNEVTKPRFNDFIDHLIEKRQFGVLKTYYLNVLELNLALDEFQGKL